MNLSAKSLGRLAMLAVALFFFSCEDEPSFLGFKNSNNKFNVSYVEIAIPTSVLSIDSVKTDNLGTVLNNNYGNPFNAVGAYNDLLMGPMRAETYLQFSPSATTKLEDDAEFDSLTIQLGLNYYSYGFTGQQEMKFNLHEITGEVLKIDSLQRYYSYSTVGYNPEPVGQASIYVDEAYLDTAAQDTVLFIKGKLDETFGRRLFDLALNDPGFTFSDRNLFIQEIKGLVITPTETNGILGFNPVSAASKITLHYHRKIQGDTLIRSFAFNKADLQANPNFTNYNVDRSATEFASITQSYQPVQPTSGIRAVQSGSPLITKLDLTNFYKFADSLTDGNALINSAELVITNVGSPEGMEAHPALVMVVMNNDNELFAFNTSETLNNLRDYHIINPDRSINPDRRFHVFADAPSDAEPRAILGYNADEEKISGFVTLFTQSLFRNRKDKQGNINGSRITYLALYPYPSIARGVHRTVFNADNIRLRINYTIPTAVIKQ